MSEIPIRTYAKRAFAASRELLTLATRAKRDMLSAMADSLEAEQDSILAANEADMKAAHEHGRPTGFVERLEITHARLGATIRAIRIVADLNDPIGEQVNRWIRPNGIEIIRVRVPIGVVAVAYESRPLIIANAAAICVKLGNALLLAGDSDAERSGQAILNALLKGGQPQGLPKDSIQAVFSDNPAVFREIARMQGLVDLLIPRGNPNFVADLVDHATVPVLKHLDGHCSIYVDEGAPTEMAVNIIHDARCNEPYSCNSADRLLLHPAAAPEVIQALVEHPVCKRMTLLLDQTAQDLLQSIRTASNQPEKEDAQNTIKLHVSIVDDMDDAIERINSQGSHVADTIVTDDADRSERFTREVDSACVCVNSSPRFADGGEFGMGAEIGFSTDKLHARGPMGLNELTSTKYIVRGKGQTRNA